MYDIALQAQKSTSLEGHTSYWISWPEASYANAPYSCLSTSIPMILSKVIKRNGAIRFLPSSRDMLTTACFLLKLEMSNNKVPFHCKVAHHAQVENYPAG